MPRVVRRSFIFRITGFHLYSILKNRQAIPSLAQGAAGAAVLPVLPVLRLLRMLRSCGCCCPAVLRRGELPVPRCGENCGTAKSCPELRNVGAALNSVRRCCLSSRCRGGSCPIRVPSRGTSVKPCSAERASEHCQSNRAAATISTDRRHVRGSTARLCRAYSHETWRGIAHRRAPDHAVEAPGQSPPQSKTRGQDPAFRTHDRPARPPAGRNRTRRAP